MSRCKLRHHLLLIAYAFLPIANAFTPSEDGLYAVFNTSEGEFTATLYFQEVPITVANFVGLAENSISHFDDDTGVPQNRPFYDGIAFHRIVENFVIQVGSPDGTGSDGPGFTFADEIDTNLKHNQKGILSMANAGPNTNGSQFFVTLSSETATHLDGKHAVFGVVIDGIEVVDAIGLAPTNEAGTPISPITINSVTILRVGSEAESFDPPAFHRPFEVAVDPKVEIGNGGDASVRFQRTGLRDYFLYKTSDFSESEGPSRLLWSDEEPEVIRHDFDLPSGPDDPVFYHYSELSSPWSVSLPGASVTFELPTDRGFGSHTVTFGENKVAAFTSVFNPEEVLECEYGWFDLGDLVQIYFFFPFQSWYEVQIYLDKDNLNPEEAFMAVNDPFVESFTHTGPFTFTPAP